MKNSNNPQVGKATVHLSADDAGFECVYKVTNDFRDLKATVPSIEFGAVQWAAKRSLVQHPNGKLGPMNLDTFMRLALLAKIREVVKAEIAKGKPIPPDIAAILDESRR
jgi:hypothetical protein